MLLREVLRRYFARNLCLEKSRAKAQYRLLLARFDEFVGHEATTADLSDENLVGFIRHRQQSCSVHTADREASRLVTLWKFAAMLGECSFPTIKLKRHAPPLPEAWLESELRAIFAAAAKYPILIKGCPGPAFMLSLLGVFWDTGERLEPVIDLDRCDVDIKRRHVRFRGRKGRSPDSVCEISKSTARDLKRLLALHGHPKVFAGAHRTTLYYHLPRLLSQAGLPADRRCKFHKLRKSHASHLHAAGGNATDSLGHSSDAVTRAHYLDPRVTRKESAVACLFNPRRRKWWPFD